MALPFSNSDLIYFNNRADSPGLITSAFFSHLKTNCMFDVENFMLKVAAWSPFVLTALAFATFLGVGIFFVDYYQSVLSFRFGGYSLAFGIFLAVIHEAVRFALLVSSLRDFGDKKTANAWLGLVGSIALVWHDISVAGDLSAMYAQSGASAGTFQGLLTFLILLGLLLELRLILTIEKRVRYVKADPVNGQYQMQFPEPVGFKNQKHNGKEVLNKV